MPDQVRPALILPKVHEFTRSFAYHRINSEPAENELRREYRFVIHRKLQSHLSFFEERIPPFTAGVNPTTTPQSSFSSNTDI